MNPTITIITVVRNAKHTIQCALDSVAQQNYPQVEHLILDGASTDGTLQIIEAFAKMHPNVVYSSKPDKGMYHALNEGIHRAQGDIIGFLHADDYFKSPDVLKTIAHHTKDLDGVYGDLVYIDPQKDNKIRRYWQSSPFKAGSFKKGWHPPHTALFLKKTVYDRFGAFNTDFPLGNDVELMMRLFEKHKINTYYIPKVLVCMRLGGISNRSFRNIWLQNRTIMQAFALNGLKVFWPSFIFYKSMHRLKQFFRQPRESSYVS